MHQTGAESAANRTVGEHYADVTDLFYTADRHPTFDGNILVCVDERHLTLQISQELALAIASLVKRELADG